MEKFINDYKDKCYKIKVDTKSYCVPVIKIIYFLFLSEKDLLDYLNDDSKKEENLTFVYIIISFIKTNYILKKYALPEQIINRILNIQNYKYVDFYAINKVFNESENNFLINDNLKKEILNSVPNDISKLEKSIYIYIKLCKILTYDEEYLIKINENLQNNKRNFNNISVENNKVVCFEFTYLFAQLLSEIKINYEIINTSYSPFSHSYLIYRVGEYLVSADSVTSLLDGDLTRAKLNIPLIGLNANTPVFKTREKFKEIVKNVHNKFEILDSLNIACNNNDFLDKLTIFMDLISKSSFKGIDLYAYIFYLREKIFIKKEIKEYIKISKILNSNNTEKIQLNLLISIKYIDVEDFFIIDNNGVLKKYKKEYIINKFYYKDFKYVSSSERFDFENSYEKIKSER